MAAIRQTSFLGGEFHPRLRGRSDLAIYEHGLSRCRNFIITKEGAAVSRPGSSFVAYTKYSTQNERVKLVPFVFSDDTSYVLEFGNRYIRVYKNRALHTEISTSWTIEKQEDIVYAQVGNTLFFVPKRSVFPITPAIPAVWELRRNPDDTWELKETDFNTKRPFPDFSASPSRRPALIRRDALYKPQQDLPASNLIYKVTYVFRTEEGEYYETDPYEITEEILHSYPVTYNQIINRTSVPRPLERVFPDWPLLIYVGWLFAHQHTLVEARIYCGNGGLYGRIGTLRGPEQIPLPSPTQSPFGLVFKDEGIEPDFTRQPPSRDNPFLSETKPAVYGFPNTIGFHNQRFVIGGTSAEPYTVKYSAVDSFYNFDIVKPVSPGDASGRFDLALQKKETIRSMVSLDQLLIFTESSVWAVDDLNPATFPTVRRQTSIGASGLQPLTINQAAFWVKTKGNGIYRIHYDWETRSYVTNDMIQVSSHFFEGRRVVDWAHVEDPSHMIWAVLDDGALLTGTVEGNQISWARHETDGSFESICSVPEDTGDAVYVAVRRKGRLFLERIDPAAARLRLDCSTEYFEISRDETITVTGLSRFNGRDDVWAAVDGRVSGPHTVSGGSLTLQVPPGTGPYYVSVGLKYTPELELLDVDVTRHRVKVLKKVSWEVVASQGLWTGESFDRLYPWKQQTMEVGYGANEEITGVAEVLVSSRWNKGGRAVLRQEDPFPVTVLGVTREGHVGG